MWLSRAAPASLCDLPSTSQAAAASCSQDEAVVGVISIGDLVKSIIDDQRFTIGQLETYISGEVYVH